MITGYKRDVEENDLWQLPEEDQSDILVPKLQKMWDKEEEKCQIINR